MAEKLVNKFDESFPKVLFKYRDWRNIDHQRLLTDGEVYFPSFNQLNDPFEGKIPYRYNPTSLTSENIFQKYLSVAKEKFPGKNDSELHSICYDYQKRDLLHDDKHLEAHFIFEHPIAEKFKDV